MRGPRCSDDGDRRRGHFARHATVIFIFGDRGQLAGCDGMGSAEGVEFVTISGDAPLDTFIVLFLESEIRIAFGSDPELLEGPEYPLPFSAVGIDHGCPRQCSFLQW